MITYSDIAERTDFLLNQRRHSPLSPPNQTRTPGQGMQVKEKGSKGENKCRKYLLLRGTAQQKQEMKKKNIS